MTMLQGKSDPIRVVVIDDSPTARDLLVAALQSAPGIQVIGTGADGQEAVRLVQRLRPDVVTMDIRMPGMDGLEATRRIMREAPTPIVVVSSAAAHSDGGLTFEAMRAGALTVVSKPGLNDPEACDQVVQTVRLMSGVPVVHHWDRKQAGSQKVEGGTMRSRPPTSDFQPPTSGISIIGIAASTGGPAALAAVLAPLPASFPLPILAVQHITRGFAAGLADWLDSQTALRVSMARHGETPQPGTVLVAPDDYHLQVNGRRVMELVKEPPYKGLRPSANYMFGSLARAYGQRAMGVLLTGMGDDGADGLEALHRTGGLTIAQDEQSCIVYGMPREAILRDVVDRVLSLDQIAATLDRFALYRRATDYE